jgi:hypothetical protein
VGDLSRYELWAVGDLSSKDFVLMIVKHTSCGRWATCLANLDDCETYELWAVGDLSSKD